MSRINGGSPQAPKTQPQKTQAPAPKVQAQKTQAPAAPAKNTVAQPQGDRFDTKAKQAGSVNSKPVGAPPDRITKQFSSSARNQINHLANSSTKKATVNQDGSETRKIEAKTPNGKSHEVELTTKKGMLREAQTKYSKTTKQTDKAGTTHTTKYEAAGKSDMFGRTTTSQSKQVSQATGDAKNGGELTKTQGRTQARDQWGLKKESTSQGTTFKTGPDEKHHTTQSQNQTVTTDRFGNKAVVNEKSTARQNDKHTVTKGTKDTKGTELNTTSSAKFEEGKYSIGESADWKKHRVNSEKTYSREYQRKELPETPGFDPANQNDKLSKLQKGADLVGAVGPKKELYKGEIPKGKMVENNRIKGKDGKDDPNTFVGTRNGVAGKYEVTLNAGGVDASGNIERKHGVYAETKTPDIDETKGGRQRSGAAKAEAKASAEGKAKINSNGVDASGNAKIGVTLEASGTGKAQSKTVTIAGEKLNAGAEITGKVSAQATAELNAKVKITRNPKSAIIEGGAGASAVVKAEAEAKVNAGPFAVKGNIYGSAGAEATAKGSIGYENGKVKINGSLGAAVGLGAGGGVAVEVDVKQIGNMAKNTAQPYVDKAKKAAQPHIDKAKKAADLNRDGKLDAKDAQLAAKKARSTVANAVTTAQTQVQNRVNKARTTVTRTAQNVQSNFNNAVNTARTSARRTVSNVQRNVNQTVSNVQRNATRTAQNVQRSTNRAVQNVQRNVTRTAQNVQRNVNQTVSNVQRNVTRTTQNVQRNVARTASTVQRNVNRTVSNVQRNVTRTASAVQNNVNRAVNTARSNVNHAVNNARNTVNNAANNVKRFLGW